MQATLRFTVLGTPGEDDIKVLQLLQSQWKEAGIEMSIETLEQTAYISRAVVSDFQALFSRNYGYADPDTNYIFWAAATRQGRRQPQHQLRPVHLAAAAGGAHDRPAERLHRRPQDGLPGLSPSSSTPGFPTSGSTGRRTR